VPEVGDDANEAAAARGAVRVSAGLCAIGLAAVGPAMRNRCVGSRLMAADYEGSGLGSRPVSHLS
jgi:hypothetical protein